MANFPTWPGSSARARKSSATCAVSSGIIWTYRQFSSYCPQSSIARSNPPKRAPISAKCLPYPLSPLKKILRSGDNKACLRLPGIDGKAKMSKSLGNCIYLGEDADEVKKKVMSMFTDPNHLRVEDPGQVEDNPVFIYLDAFSRPEHFERHFPDYQNIEEMKAHYTRGGLGDMKVKKFLNNVLQDELEPIRNRRRELEKDIPAIYDILKEGSMRAREAAARTLDDVRRAMKINYFEDMDLISEQAKKYARSCG